MRCDEARALLSARLDGALAPAEEAAALAHLQGCPECRAAAGEFAALRDLLRGIPRPSAPDGFAARVAGALPARPRARGRLLRFVPFAAAACAAVVLAVLVLRPPGRETAGSGLTVAYEARSASGDLPREKGLGLESAREGSGDAAPPAEPEWPAGPGAPAAAVPRGAGPESDTAADPGVGYVVSGPSPDAAAGILLAEIDHRRRREDRKPEALAACTETLVADERGEPASLVLCLTPEETEYLVRLIRARGAKVRPRPDAGRRAGEDSGSSGTDRCRVEFLFGR